MDHDYELEDDYAPRVLWGRLAFFLVALVLAFIAGRACAPEGVPAADYRAEQDKVQELASQNAVLQQQVDAANEQNQGGNNGGNNQGEGGGGNAEQDPSEAATDEPVGEGQTYTVQNGDTLTTIAEEFYNDPTKFDLIVDANNLTEDTPLRVGQELIIPPDPG